MAYQSEIEKLEQRFSEKPEQWFAAVADAYRKAGDLDRAIEVLNTWIEKRPKYTSGHIVLGRCLVDKGEDQQAAPVFEGVLGLDPENIIALKTLGEIAERLGDREQALRWVDRLLEVDPMSQEAHDARERLSAPPEVDEEVPVEVDVAAEVAPETPAAPAAPAVGEAPEPGVVDLDEPLPPAEPIAAAPQAQTVAEGLEAVEFEAPEPEAQTVAEGLEAMEFEAPEPEAAPEVQTVAEGFEAMEFEAPEPETAPAGGLEESEATVEMPELGFDEVVEEEVEVPGPASELVAVPEFEVSDEMPPAAAESADVEEVEELVLSDVEAVGAAPVDGLEPPVPVAGAEEVGVVAEDLGMESFDEELAWDAGERISHSISRDDIEEALASHDDQVDAPAHAIPGLEGAEVPQVGVEGRDTPPAPGLMGVDTVPRATPPPAEPEPTADEDVLPLILPPEEAEVPTASVEPEPVVTETMAELYVRQGLYAEARAIYEQLLAERPGDPDLMARLDKLERRAGPSAPTKGVANRYSVALTGGTSARAFFSRMAAAAPGATDSPPPVEEVTDVGPAEPIAVDAVEPPPSEPVEPSPQPDETQALEAGEGTAGESGFSFDEFFGGEQAEEEQGPASEDAADEGEGEDDDFRAWLQGLKT